MDYFIIVDREQRGPFKKEELLSAGLTPATMVWCAGMPDWATASSLPDLADLFYKSGTQSAPYFAIINGIQTGPESIDTLISKGLTPQSPVWQDGMTDWAPANTRPDISEKFRENSGGAPNYATPPRSGYTQPPYTHPMSGMQGGYNPDKPRMNWMPWAITGTILGFFCSCIGVIFGIIGIVQANKANKFYEQGKFYEGDNANSQAKTMAIISLVLAGVAVVSVLIYLAIFGVYPIIWLIQNSLQ